MEVGEKYLYVKVLGQVELKAFPNDKKDKNEQPDFVGDGVAVWVREKLPPKNEEASKKNRSLL